MSKQKKLSENLGALLVQYVGDNIGENCTCTSCENNRAILRMAIQEEIEQAIQEAND